MLKIKGTVLGVRRCYKTQGKNSNLCFQRAPVSLLMLQEGGTVDEPSEWASEALSCLCYRSSQVSCSGIAEFTLAKRNGDFSNRYSATTA